MLHNQKLAKIKRNQIRYYRKKYKNKKMQLFRNKWIF